MKDDIIMDTERIWTTTDLNKFIYQQTKALCEANGFVVSPRRSKHLVRVKEHHIQIVYPEIYRSCTSINFGVSPAASFRSVIFGYARVHLRKNNHPATEFFNEYHMLAIDPWSSKRVYESEKMREVWNKIVVPQLEEEMFSVLKPFGFEQFIVLCENQKNGILRYVSNPGIDDASLDMARGHNRIWKGNIKESIPFLEQALSGYEKHFISCEKLGEEVFHDIQEEHSATQELLSVIKNGEDGMEAKALECMRELENIALNKAWGVARSPEGNTIRLKKKELL